MYSTSDGIITILYTEGIPPHSYGPIAKGTKYILVWRASAMVGPNWLDAIIVERAICTVGKEVDGVGAWDTYEPRVFIGKDAEAIRYAIDWYDGKRD